MKKTGLSLEGVVCRLHARLYRRADRAPRILSSVTSSVFGHWGYANRAMSPSHAAAGVTPGVFLAPHGAAESAETAPDRGQVPA